MESYPRDLSKQEWAFFEPLIPAGKPGGRPREVDMRQVLNGIFYILRAGCAWRRLPPGYRPRSTVSHYFALFRKQGGWERIMTTLRERCRLQAGREATPSAAIEEMFVKGVSQAQVGQVVETLTGTHPSPSAVSRVFHTLDAEYEQWKNRPLCAQYAYAFAEGERNEKNQQTNAAVNQVHVASLRDGQTAKQCANRAGWPG